MCASLSCIIACLAHVYKATWALQKKRVLIGEERHTVLNVFIYLLGITWLHFVLLHLHLLWFHLSDRICILEKKKKTLLGKKKLLHIAITTLMSSFRFDCVPGGKNWMTICQMQRKTKPRHEFSMNRLFHNYVKSIPSSTNCLIQPGPTFRVDPTPCKTAHAVLAKAGISTSIIEIKVLSPASGLHMFINNKLQNK